MGNSSVPLYINLYNTYVEQYSKERPRKKRPEEENLCFSNRRNYGKGNREWGMGNGEWRMKIMIHIYIIGPTLLRGIATAKRKG